MNSASPPAPCCRPGIDRSGENLYVADEWILPASGAEKYVAGAHDSTLASTGTRELTVDQSKADGHIFVLHAGGFEEFEACTTPGCFGTQVPGSPFGGDLLGDSPGIAYNPILDRVYVSDLASKTVKVFGPVTSGTVPNVSCESVDGITAHTATAHCTVNPLGLPNSYHLEWKQGSGASWGAAQSAQPPYPSIEPSDSSPHSVSIAIPEKLDSATSYQVRLVGTNAEAAKNNLSAYSVPVDFKTPTPDPPLVSACSVSAVTTSAAHFACTIDPQEEETSWQVKEYRSHLQRRLLRGSPADDPRRGTGGRQCSLGPERPAARAALLRAHRRHRPWRHHRGPGQRAPNPGGRAERSIDGLRGSAHRHYGPNQRPRQPKR